MRAGVLLAGLATLVLVGLAPAAASAAGGDDAVLILYDSRGEWGWLGDLYAQQLANLVGHFPLTADRQPVESYSPGQLHTYRATFYLGSTYDNPLPAGFIADVWSSVRPICWLKYNLWQLAWDEGENPKPEFEARWGFGFWGLVQDQWDQVRYRDRTYTRDAADPEIGVVGVSDPELAEAPAWALRPPYMGDGSAVPYVVRGGNLWYVADIPFSYAGPSDRYLVFCDLLHDILGVDHAESHRALLRIEDVSADADPEALRAIADALALRGLPFHVAVTPCFRDPLAADPGVQPSLNHSLALEPEVLAALRYMAAQGGRVVAHGYTHQYDAAANPFNGKTGDDYECYRVSLDCDGQPVFEGPLPGDSPAWAQARAAAADRELRSLGLRPVAWEVPHYTASADDFVGFAQTAGVQYHRALYFAQASPQPAPSRASFARARRERPRGRVPGTPYLGRDPHLGVPVRASQREPVYMLGQFFPYIIHQDVYGQKLVPENLHHLNPEAPEPFQLLPEDLLGWAELNLSIRDGWASAYFHWYLGLAYLEELLDGLIALGYEFVPVTAQIE